MSRPRTAAPAPRTATTRDVTSINRTAILDLLRQSGPLSRREIRHRTGLSPATVERLTQSMLESGAIGLGDLDRSGGGRPSQLLEYVSDIRTVAAVDITEMNARGRVLDLRGNVLHEVYEPFDFTAGSPASVRLEGVLSLIDRLASSETGLQAPLAVIGIALPGITHDGTVEHATELDWRGVPIAQIVSERTGLPVLVENDANATVYSERSRGAAQGAENAVALVLGMGVRAGIVSDGGIHRGFGAAAGQLGYLLRSSQSFARYFTDVGDLESSLTEQVHPYLQRDGTHTDRRIGPAFRAMMAQAASGDLEASSASAEFFDSIALVCVAITVVLSPKVLVLGGAFAQYSELSADEIRRRLVGRIPHVPEIVPSQLGFDAAITGIGDLAIERARDATYLA